MVVERRTNGKIDRVVMSVMLAMHIQERSIKNKNNRREIRRLLGEHLSGSEIMLIKNKLKRDEWGVI